MPKMDRKRELKEIYKEMRVEAGVYQIKNARNGKIFIGTTRNFKSLNGLRFSLKAGTFTNKELQKDWNYYGESAFSIEILEVLKKKDDPYFNEKEALSELENKWMKQLQPYEEQGYNKRKKR